MQPLPETSPCSPSGGQGGLFGQRDWLILPGELQYKTEAPIRACRGRGRPMTGKNLSPFGRAAREYRRRYGLSIKSMAEQIGCSATYVSLVELGQRRLPKTWAALLPDELRAMLAEASV